MLNRFLLNQQISEDSLNHILYNYKGILGSRYSGRSLATSVLCLRLLWCPLYAWNSHFGGGYLHDKSIAETFLDPPQMLLDVENKMTLSVSSYDL